MQGTALPYVLSLHAMINMENGNTMIIGGDTESGRTEETNTIDLFLMYVMDLPFLTAPVGVHPDENLGGQCLL